MDLGQCLGFWTDDRQQTDITFYTKLHVSRAWIGINYLHDDGGYDFYL